MEFINDIKTQLIMAQYYPYPEGLESREHNRKNQPSERLKRMTDREVQQWEQEAYRLSMKELIDEGIKPLYPVTAGRIRKKSLECDLLFERLILKKL